MDSFNWAGIVVALIGVISAWLSGRSARKAALYSSDASTTNARTVAETEAYNRARKMDTETIARQDQEIEELRQENEQLRLEIKDLRLRENALSEENTALRRRVERLERYFNGRREQR